jgi:hypothetical protein
VKVCKKSKSFMLRVQALESLSLLYQILSLKTKQDVDPKAEEDRKPDGNRTRTFRWKQRKETPDENGKQGGQLTLLIADSAIQELCEGKGGRRLDEICRARWPEGA